MISSLRLIAAVVFSVASFPSMHAQATEKDVTRVPVVFSGGHDTLTEDRGRPVILIAAALGVKPEVFREAFSGVRPAGPGRGPTGEEARRNKAVLMEALGKHGITNERLDEVSDFYRYPPGRGGMWAHQAAEVNALIKDGKVIGYEVVKGGAGYTSVPMVTVPGHPEAAATVELAYGKDMEKNGGVSAVRVGALKAGE